MTKILFVDPRPRGIYDKHSIYYLSAFLKLKGSGVEYVQGTNHAALIDEIAAVSPDLLLYSAYSTDLDAYVAFDRLAKERINVKSLIGGPGPTFDQDFLEDSTIDALCIGEGEYAIQQYIESGLESGGNIVTRGNPAKLEFNRLISDLDALPFPDREIVYGRDPLLRSVNYKMFLTGRGCPYNCTYCYNNLYNRKFKEQGKVVRHKSVDYVIEEMKECARRYPYQVAVFQDDTFIYNKKWLEEFCTRMPRDIGVPFLCNVRPNLVDEDTVLTLKAGGCTGVSWSIESGCAELREKVLRRPMPEECISRTAELLNRHGLKHRIGNIIGIPGETWDQVVSTLELNLKARPFLAIANIFVPFKGLELTQYALDHAFLKPDYLSRLPTSYSAYSVMEVPWAFNVKLQKMAFLFPVFVRFPFLYRNGLIRKVAFALPRLICKMLAFLVYSLRMAKLYRVRHTPVAAFRLFIREVNGGQLGRTRQRAQHRDRVPAAGEAR